MREAHTERPIGERVRMGVAMDGLGVLAVTPAVLAVAFVAVALDVGSAWAGWPTWAIGSVLLSPALPLVAVLMALMGWSRLGGAGQALFAWREFLVGGLLIVLVVAWRTRNRPPRGAGRGRDTRGHR